MILLPVTTPAEAALVARLAGEIWTEHYTPLIGSAQVAYMLARFQSPDAIRHAIEAEGFSYYLLWDDIGCPAAYCGALASADALFISKLYVVRAGRGKGFARLLLDRALADALGVKKIWLTVNKGNESAIAAYKRLGFFLEEEITTDIGGGFVMDDYKMVKLL